LDFAVDDERFGDAEQHLGVVGVAEGVGMGTVDQLVDRAQRPVDVIGGQALEGSADGVADRLAQEAAVEVVQGKGLRGNFQGTPPPLMP
jgi:hypothetical protein